MKSAARNTATRDSVRAHRDATATEVLDGLAARPRQISPKFFYDRKGSALFDAITGLDEYYIPRVEKAIFTEHGDSICAALGTGRVIIEPGAGSCEKIKWLLPGLDPALYIPMDISAAHLRASAAGLRNEFPGLAVEPQVCDHTVGLDIDAELYADLPARSPVFFYPGSSIGNFEPAAAVEFLARMRARLAPGGGLLIGVDAKKDPDVLHAAYNDSAGITAEFNLNALDHINDLLAGDIDTASFRHVAYYDEELGRIEMHLECTAGHKATLAGEELEFVVGERIHTENSYKYHPEEFAELAAAAGFRMGKLWQDEQGYFSVLYFEAA